MKPGAITLLTTALVERGLTFVGKVEGDTKVVSASLPVVNLNPRDINRLATKLANRAFDAIKGSRLVFSTPYVDGHQVSIVISAEASKNKSTKKDKFVSADEVSTEAPAEVEGVDIYAHLEEGA
jgi:hypothetical protein